MDIKLKKTEEEMRAQFSSLRRGEDLASLLEISHQKLTYYLNGLEEEKKYFNFQIPKKSGLTRNIYAPNVGLKVIQQKLSSVLYSAYRPAFSVNGFVRKRNIVTNAKVHSNKKFVLNLDLQDFFPTIHFGRVMGMFMVWPYKLNRTVAIMLSQICCYKGELPQGAPTSPVISNMICAKLDTDLQRFAGKNRCQYTRYGDDLTFSTSLNRFPSRLAEWNISNGDKKIVLGNDLVEIIEKNNKFKINYSKVRLQKENHRQAVTGLITNRFPNVKRKYIRQIRAMLHAWEIYGLKLAEVEFHKKFNKCRLSVKKQPCFKAVLKGKIEFLGMVRGKDNPMYCSFMHKYNKLVTQSEGKVGVNIMKDKYDAFISYASEDKKTFVTKLARALIRKGFNVWFDDTEIKVGDSICNKIDQGLLKSKFAIVVFSKAFFEKNWPKRELEGLVSLEIADGKKRILPIWYKINKEDILKFSPPLTNICALVFPELTLEEIIKQLSVKLKQG